VATEVVSGRETPDAIGWRQTHPPASVLIECKASRADFRADQKKFFRVHDRYGIGKSRYYMAPAGILTLDDIPRRWGFLEVHGTRVRVIRRSEPFPDHDKGQEIRLLLSCIRRIGQAAPEGVSVRCYTYRTKNTATLGVAEDGENSEDPD
jgi:hypothetical protein